MSSSHPFLTIDAEHQSDAYVVRITGELDLSGCPDVELALEQAEQSEADRIKRFRPAGLAELLPLTGPCLGSAVQDAPWR